MLGLLNGKTDGAPENNAMLLEGANTIEWDSSLEAGRPLLWLMEPPGCMGQFQ